MVRAPRQVGDKIVISTVGGGSERPYELIPTENNYNYRRVSDQPEVEVGQEISWPLTFHGGLVYSNYNLSTVGIFAYTDNSPLGYELNVIHAPTGTTNVTLTGAANPPMYFFESTVNDSGADDGKPVLYIIAVESGEVNVYKLSLDSANFGTLLRTETFTVTTTQPMGRPAEWNNGSTTLWYLPLGDNGKIRRLASIVSSTSADTWETGTNTADARHLQVVDNRLMRSTNENRVSLLPRAGDPTDDSAWGADFFVGDVSRNITELGEAGGQGYIAKTDGFYEWDTVGQAINIFPEIGIGTRNGQGMVYWHGGFLIPAESGLWWTRTGTPVGPDDNPFNYGNQPTLGSIDYIKHGRWMGLAPFGPYIFGLYVSSDSTASRTMWGRERDESDPPGWGPIIWHDLNGNTADLDDFHGIFTAKTSEFGATDIRPTLWMANGNNISYKRLDRNGSPISRRGDVDLATSGRLITGRINMGYPTVNKQLQMIEGWSSDTGGDHSWQLGIYPDLTSSVVNVGSTITGNGLWQRLFTQDSNDVAREFNLEFLWAASTSLTSQNGDKLHDIVIRAILLPNTTPVWTFNFWLQDKQSKTAKLERSELEAYLRNLQRYELPDGDTFNGVMTSLRLLRAQEVSTFRPLLQPPPKYVLQAEVREMTTTGDPLFTII